MGIPTAALAGSGIGALGFMKLITEPSWGGGYTFLGGTSCPIGSIASGVTVVYVTSPANMAVGQYMWFDDGLEPTNNNEYPNLNEPAIKITGITGNAITLTSATTQTHYGPTATGLNTSGSRVHTGWLPNKGCYYESETLNAAINLWGPEMISASRIGTQHLLKGPEKVTGNIVMPLGPGYNNDFFVGAVGYEQETFGTTPTGTGTLSSASAVGAITISCSSTFTAGQFIQFDITPNREVRQVVGTPTGTGPYVVTLDQPLRFAHAISAVVKVVVAPFTHSEVLGNVLPSFGLEKFVAGDAQFGGSAVGTTFQVSYQYTGMYVGKWQMKVDNKTGPKLTLSMEGQGEILMPASTAPTYPSADPFAFYDTYISIGGVQLPNASDFELTIDNKLAQTTFLNNSTKVGVIKPGLRMIEGKLALYYSGYTNYTDFRAIVDKNLVVQFYQAATGYSTTFNFTKVDFTKYDVKAPVNGLVMVDIDFKAKLDQSTSTEGTVSLVDGNWLNYGF